MRVRSWTLPLPLVALATVLFAVTPAQAAIIFSDFGPGNEFYPHRLVRNHLWALGECHNPPNWPN